jgi:putative hydrolases of HD superfamily
MSVHRTTTGITNFIFEVFSLKRLKRSSYQTLGSDSGSIAEHSYCVAMIGYLLGNLESADVNKIIKMCLIHDLAETRTGDANFVQKRYQILADTLALTDATHALPQSIQKEIISLYQEFEEGKTNEAVIAREADKLEQLFQEKIIAESGNSQAKDWLKYSLSTLTTKFGGQIGTTAMKTTMHGWWDSIGKKPSLSQSKKLKVAHLLKTIIK